MIFREFILFDSIKINRSTHINYAYLQSPREARTPFTPLGTESAIKRHGYFICAVIAYFDFFPVIQPARTGAFKGPSLGWALYVDM